PVNPSHTSVQGRRSFARLEDIGAPVDLAVIATPAATVPGIIEQCGQAGVGAAVVLSAGFGESGEAGRDLEAELRERSRVHGVRVLGPNCLGVMLPHCGVNATFSNNQAAIGQLALVSQSGAL